MAEVHGVVDLDVCFGYFIVGDVLVPNAFLDRLGFHLGSEELNYGDALSPRQLCGDEFFLSLTDEEREVLGPCILLLVDEGRISMRFPGEDD